ncbi:MAG: hybrid sensor histidine kinase/response regulator [Candidatus Parabeggiatoa sp. nov. 2]|nr:MAG: hypothetical protein B6247_00370 [Beggiatoa sp. 4572_84]RKZ64599.1 MAG: hybrid sensor histidine kinase/response regulator [Gammaproteobacteria bacterium]HEC83896.1 response regulator [Thioploca sp.]
MSLIFHNFRSVLGLAILIAAGLVGNYYNVPLFFGVNFLFGSIAVLIVVHLYKTHWGTLAAAIVGSYTMILWGHPYAVIIFTLEAFFVGWWLRRQKQLNFVLLDSIYWVLIGMPLVWLFYSGVMGMGTIPVVLIMLKQAINGIFNALVASLLLAGTPLYKWIARSPVNVTLSLQQTLLNLLVAFVFFPTLTLMVLESRKTLSDIKTNIQSHLQTISSNREAELLWWHQQQVHALHELAKIAARTEMTPSTVLQQSTEMTQRLRPDLYHLYIVDTKGNIITNAPIHGAHQPSHFNNKNYSHQLCQSKQHNMSEMWIESDEGPSFHVELCVPVYRDNRLLGHVSGHLSLDFIAELLKSSTQALDLQITLIDSQERVIMSTRPDLKTKQLFDPRQSGEIRPVSGTTIYQWLPAENMPLMVRWRKSFYIKETQMADKDMPWRLLVESPISSHISNLQTAYIKSLAIMLLITVLAIIVATLISRQATASLSNLARVTTNLPNKLLERETIAWPNSLITEINSLVDNFKLMAQTLEQKFKQVQVEADLRAAKEAAEEANRTKSEFLANMSHELRTPLNGILGFAQILKRDKSLNAEQLDGIHTIEQSGQHLLVLINDILDMSKIEAGKMELHHHDFRFSNFLKGIVDLFQIQAKQKKIDFQSEINAYLPTAVHGDETRLRQVLVNMLGNAVKFTEKGFVNFRVGYCEHIPNEHSPNPFQEGSRLNLSIERIIRFEIEDSGPGIEHEQLETIFQPFKQVGAQRYMTEGTGLGLPLCQKFVQMMGGTLAVKSTVGKGSVFWFDLALPAVEGWTQVEKTPTEQRITGFKGKPRRILIVDDKGENRALLFELLSPLKFDIVEAFNGEIAIEIALAFRPDVIFMDILMPVMDGLEATSRIRQLSKLKEVTIIAVSASVSFSEREKTLAVGCNDFIAKPVATEEVLEKLRFYLKLEWEYEADNSVELSPSPENETEPPLVEPSAEVVKMLYDWAMMGDVESIVEKIDQLEQTDSQFAPFAAQVRPLAEAFMVREIGEFLESILNSDQ